MAVKVFSNPKPLNGEIIIPSDKSISHRAVIFASIANGTSVIKNFSNGKDPHSSLEICRKLGADVCFENGDLIIKSKGKYFPLNDEVTLNCGNSGTTMRLMSGVLAGQNFNSVLIGDESLSKRPMKRVIEPLSLMGANIESHDYRAPLKIKGSELCAVNYESKIASAQVKSCVLLAGLYAKGTTSYKEIYPSRNHTEIMLSHMGANINIDNNVIYISKSDLNPLNIEIPGDISSAAFFIAAGLLVPDSKIIIKNVGLNETRSGMLKVLNTMGANVEILDKHEVCGEVVGDIKVEYTEELSACEIHGEIIPALIDEIPIIAVLATQANGTTIIKDAQDLRNKESDRIKLTVSELKKLGADIEETPDGMIIHGKNHLKGGVEVDSYKDHRLAMSLYVAGLICEKDLQIRDFEWVNISFPEFETLMGELIN